VNGHAKPWPAGTWRQILAGAVRDIGQLLEILELDAETLGVGLTSSAARRFPPRVPRGFVSRMRRGDPNDPLLRQVLPVPAEDDETTGFTTNPVGELGLLRGDGLLSKYRRRSLLVTTGSCAVHCRYCFRRHFPYLDARSDLRIFEGALRAISRDADLEEVILSGGDPLMLPDEGLAALVHALASVPHIRRVRIHTRMPVVLPERVDEALMKWLADCELQMVIVIHANHPQEIDHQVRRALSVLATAGVTLLNQAVVLRGVNDCAGTLEELATRLFDCGVLPYYLHLLDRVAGAAHFEVGEDQAVAILDELRARLPGYLVPRLVREVEGAPSKVPVG
jgi:EF-P beta-lysylation protein EpmB